MFLLLTLFSALWLVLWYVVYTAAVESTKIGLGSQKFLFHSIVFSREGAILMRFFNCLICCSFL